MTTPSHLWVRGPLRADRAAYLETLGLPEPVIPGQPTVDAHARLRGPYTAIGCLVRGLVHEALDRWPELVQAHDLEVLTVAPELRATVPAARETLTSLAIPAERTRFYSRLRTLRMAHGLTELVRDHVAALGSSPRSLVVENVHHADPTDVEAIAVLLRRVDPGLLTLVVCTDESELPPELWKALTTYATAHHAQGEEPPAGRQTSRRSARPADRATLAAAYVEGDCTDEDPRVLAAYEATDKYDRAGLHDSRAEELERRDELSLRLGAIPFHRERGSDPAGAGAQAVRYALDYCIDTGFYHAAVELGTRGRALIDWAAELELWWVFTTKMTTSLGALGRAEEAEELYDEARAFTTSPFVHQQAAYATAMLYTRHHEPDRRDHRTAKAWINEAIAISSLLPEPREQAFQTVFNRNGLALIEVHLKNLPAALELVDEGLAHLATELDDDAHLLHRSVLRYNRAQVYAGLGRLEDALADYTDVIALDPNYPEYYFDRAGILRRLDRDDEALADYEAALRLSAPFPEVFYNRADIRLSRGEVDGALADLSYVLELEPEFVDAYVNRAGLLLELGDEDGARYDVAAGLSIDPDNAGLLCVRGQLAASAGDMATARAALDRALALDPTLQAAWAERASLFYNEGEFEAAVADLDQALELGEDAAVRFNRSIALRAVGRDTDALADLDRSKELSYDRTIATAGANPL